MNINVMRRESGARSADGLSYRCSSPELGEIGEVQLVSDVGFHCRKFLGVFHTMDRSRSRASRSPAVHPIAAVGRFVE